MESLYFLIPIAFIFVAIAIKILWWAIHNGQYDNLDTEAHRILFDDGKLNNAESAQSSQETSNTLITDTDSRLTSEQYKE